MKTEHKLFFSSTKNREFFPNNYGKWKTTSCLKSVWKSTFFSRRTISFTKNTSTFCFRKVHIFATEKYKKFPQVSEVMEKNVANGTIRTHHLWPPKIDQPTHILIIKDTNDSPTQHTKSARHLRNQENEKKILLGLLQIPKKLFEGHQNFLPKKNCQITWSIPLKF